jgi:hypothetical protein
MTVPPNEYRYQLGPQAPIGAKNASNGRMAVTIHFDRHGRRHGNDQIREAHP